MEGFRRFKVIHTAGPNTAMIKTSGRNQVDVQIGGRLTYIPGLQKVDYLNLELRTLNITTERGISRNGAPVSVTSTCQVKIQGWNPKNSYDASTSRPMAVADSTLVVDEAAILLAAQHFAGKRAEDIDNTIRHTVAGHQRAIVSTMNIEQLIHDRDVFCERVVDHCFIDLRNMGLSIVSYTLVSISEEHGYIEALGATENALVQRRKIEGEAEHRSRARINASVKQTTAHINENREHIRTNESNKEKNITDAQAATRVERVKALRGKAFEITSAEREAELLVKRQRARAAELAAEQDVVRRNVEKRRLKVERKVQVEADATLYRRMLKADRSVAKAKVQAEKTIELANAYAEAKAEEVRRKGVADATVQAAAISDKGLAEAEAIRSRGLAEAEVGLKKAQTIRAEGMAELDVLEERLRIWRERYEPLLELRRSPYTTIYMYLFLVY